jgi:hypothetical protein
VHVRQPFEFDLSVFGIATENGVLTPNQWWELHTHWTLDLVTGFFYLTFIAIFVLISAYFSFYVIRTGTRAMSAERIKRYVPALMWAFFWTNVLGYMIYFIYPAAPPWYVSLYGFGPARMDALPSPAGCLRFDELLGVTLFQGMYSKSANIFGAIPSLHCAYPALAVYFSVRLKKLVALSVFYWLMVSFSAIYLSHHYVIDVLIGWSLAWVVAAGVDFYYTRRSCQE